MKTWRCAVGVVVVFWLSTLGCANLAAAQERPRPDPYRFLQWAGDDVRSLARGTISPRAALAAGGMGGLVLALSGRDEELTQGAVDLSQNTSRPFRIVANEIGNVKVVKPLAVMLFLGSMTTRDARFQDAAFTSLEAILMSNVITDALKGLTGRARPFQDEGALDFRPLSGNTSFPSGHATTVFAFTTPWLLYYTDHWGVSVFVLGTATSFTRMADRAHWFSDVVVGSAIGFSTAYWLTRRHQRTDDAIDIVPVIAAEQAGIAIRVCP